MAQEPPNIKVALFDMDRTLVNVHTARLYVRFQRQLGELSPLQVLRTGYWLTQYTLGVVNAEGVAMRVLRDYKGKSADWLNQRFHNWFHEYVLPHVSVMGTAKVEQLRLAGCTMAVATSAIRFAAEPLAEHLNIPHVVCSELEVKEGLLTGAYKTPLCYGQGKLDRCTSFVRKLGQPLSAVAFYTDSITDLPLMEAVGYPVAVNPDPRLRRVAMVRGWSIQNWRRAVYP